MPNPLRASALSWVIAVLFVAGGAVALFDIEPQWLSAVFVIAAVVLTFTARARARGGSA